MQTVIDNFVEQVIQSEVYKPMDYSYVKNRVLALVGEEGANTPTSETDIKKIKGIKLFGIPEGFSPINPDS